MSICPIIDGTIPTRQNGKTLPCATLVVENEKLRELLRDTIPYVDCHLGSDECVHLHECHGGNGCVFERLAHELGVDFDG